MTDESGVLGQNVATVPLCPPQIPHEPTVGQTMI